VDGRAERRVLTLGATGRPPQGAPGGGDWVEVRSGLDAGDRVLAASAGLVADGVRLKPTATAPAPAPRRRPHPPRLPRRAEAALPMWFTRVSIANPVMAVMVMLAFVVLGLFSYQRLKVDQFPDIDFPTVVVQTEYPGAAPEVVESEVTKKIEESVNTIAGINQLYSRSYEGTSVVIVQFNLDMDGRRAADDVREKLALIKPTLRDEVKDSRVSRFDPASVPIFSLAVTSPDASVSVQALTTYADQVVKKRLENTRGVGSVALVGGVKREINVYLKPAALEAFGVGADAVMSAVRTENQDLPAGSLRSAEAERTVQIDGRVKRPDELNQLIVARRGAQPVKLQQVAQVVDGPEEVETLALYNGKRMLALEVKKSQGENTIEVVDGLLRVVEQLKPQLPPGVALEVVRDGSRPIRVSVANVKRTLFEGALLTVGIVFLFLNSWRSTVITGLTLPIALIGTFLFMDLFGFSINMITLMAHEPVRGPADRRRHRGAREHRAPCADGQDRPRRSAGRHQRDRPGGAGHHAEHRGGVPADRLHGRHHRQVLPRVRHHHRGGGADLDVRQLHARPDAQLGLARPGHRP
jgi:hypothetical protein